MSQALSTATLQNPGKITNLEQLAQLVGQGNHVPIWADRALAQSLVQHYGGNGMVVAHPNGGPTVDVPTHGAGPGDPSGAGLAPSHLGIGYGPPGYTSPFGTNYTLGPGGSYIGPSGYPRATAVNPGDDPYGLSGGPVVGPQGNPADFAVGGPPIMARYL